MDWFSNDISSIPFVSATVILANKGLNVSSVLDTNDGNRIIKLVCNKRGGKHSDIICKLDGVQFENLKVLQERSFKDKGVKLGLFRIMYEKDGYQEEISRFVAPEKAKDNLLAVFLINPEYYFKMSGYLGELLNLVREWWQVSGNFFLE